MSCQKTKLKLYLIGSRMHFMIIGIIAMMRAYLNTYQIMEICLYTYVQSFKLHIITAYFTQHPQTEKGI